MKAILIAKYTYKSLFLIVTIFYKTFQNYSIALHLYEGVKEFGCAVFPNGYLMKKLYWTRFISYFIAHLIIRYKIYRQKIICSHCKLIFTIRRYDICITYLIYIFFSNSRIYSKKNLIYMCLINKPINYLKGNKNGFIQEINFYVKFRSKILLDPYKRLLWTFAAYN